MGAQIRSHKMSTARPVSERGMCGVEGLGNLVTGLLGAGYTGSYIFSQTLFAMRAGVATRLHGWIVAALEIGMFLLPFSVRVILGLKVSGFQGFRFTGASGLKWDHCDILVRSSCSHR